MTCKEAIRSKLYDMITYMIETTPKDKLFKELWICGMCKDEYYNIEKLTYRRMCELAWLIETYIKIREDDNILNTEKLNKFIKLAKEEYPNRCRSIIETDEFFIDQ